MVGGLMANSYIKVLLIFESSTYSEYSVQAS